MYTRNLTSAWALPRATKSGSSTLEFSRLLATVVMRTGHTPGVLRRKILSFSRNVHHDEGS